MKNKNRQTKFPVARIKKIMQKDEEVGKVAQATPIVISKALEMFLGLIIEEAHKVTSERGSKKVEAYHLKHAVETTEMLDFLKEIVEGVPDPSAGGTIDMDVGPTEGGKRKRGKAKKEGATAKDRGPEGAPTKRRRKKKGEEEQVVVKEQEEVKDVVMEPEPEQEQEEQDEEEEQTMNGHGNDDDWDGDDKPFMPRR
ncbi:histone-fold-containing protein [Guyanagaster necrorhizus]|uniref:Histone-fold-containing protein n=1 Tax=Guyanagaster necrorhizus TaxID=856835 RepID=A0A9P7VKB0_9AGAR|nr:histone-fold-containing protein [Guyanagaster necrorhizus MCA 3950]KAG7442202.1 histone-fold-containing protein [Guyanagaster necrorhizus MCA 3950]